MVSLYLALLRRGEELSKEGEREMRRREGERRGERGEERERGGEGGEGTYVTMAGLMA